MSAPVAMVRCPECQAEIAPGLLACPRCARLVHAAELTELAASAQSAEAANDLSAALAAWRRAAELLPENTAQHASVLARLERLTAAVDGRGPAAPARARGKGGAKALGAGAIGVGLLKAKSLLALLFTNGKLLLLGLTKLPTLLSMLVYLQWQGGRGFGFGFGLVASLYVHEVGHVAALRRYGIAASAPMFIPGFGALVRLKQYPTNAHEDARTGLAGPLWGLAAALVAAAIGWLWHSQVALGVASLGAAINLFNLIPVWQLDGSRGLRALSRGERLTIAAVAGVVALALHQWMPALVCIVTLTRAFSTDAPSEGDRPIFGTFGLLIVALALVATLP